jgi:hypothetical protein
MIGGLENKDGAFNTICCRQISTATRVDGHQEFVVLICSQAMFLIQTLAGYTRFL